MSSNKHFGNLSTIEKIQIRYKETLTIYYYLQYRGFSDQLKPIPSYSTCFRLSLNDKYDLSISCDPLRPHYCIETVLCENNDDYMTDITKIHKWGYEDGCNGLMFDDFEEIIKEYNRLLILIKSDIPKYVDSKDRKKQRQRIRNANRRSKKTVQ